MFRTVAARMPFKLDGASARTVIGMAFRCRCMPVAELYISDDWTEVLSDIQTTGDPFRVAGNGIFHVSFAGIAASSVVELQTMVLGEWRKTGDRTVTTSDFLVDDSDGTAKEGVDMYSMRHRGVYRFTSMAAGPKVAVAMAPRFRSD